MNILDEILKELKAIRALVDTKPTTQKRSQVCPTLIVSYDKPIAGQPTDGLSVRSRKTLLRLQESGVKKLSELTEETIGSVRSVGVVTACEITCWAVRLGAKP